ncbi:MAG: hypothetical protein ACEQSK_04920, partial [Sphingomonadaceae bacterium]
MSESNHAHDTGLTRRRFMQARSAAGIGGAGLGALPAALAAAAKPQDPWQEAQAIINRFAKP